METYHVTRQLLQSAAPPTFVPSPEFRDGIVGPFGTSAANSAASFKPSIAVIIGVLTTMFSLTFLLLLYAKHCKRSPNIGPEEFIPTPQPLYHTDSGIDRSVVEALPMFTFGSLQGMKDGLECAVCLSRFEENDILRLLPKCKHAFHLECVDTWLVSHSTCPLCRYCISAEDSLAVVEDLGVLGLRPAGGTPTHDDPPVLQGGWNSGGAATALAQARLSSSDPSSENRELPLSFFVQREGDGLSTSSRRLEMNGRKDGSLLTGEGGQVEAGAGAATAGSLPRKSSEGPISASTITGSKLFGSRNGQRPSTMPSPERSRRLGHRIIVADVVLQHRWSDFVPSDVLFLHSQTIFGREERARVSVSRNEGFPPVACPPCGKKDDSSDFTRRKVGSSLSSTNPSKTNDIPTQRDLEVGLEPRPSVEKTFKSSSKSDRDLKIFGFLSRASSVNRVEQTPPPPPPPPLSAPALDAAELVDSRLRPNQRSMSEITGLERIAHSRMSSRDFLIRGNSPEEYRIQNDTEMSRKWYSIAKRTLNWLVGGRDKRSAYNTESTPSKSPPWTSGG